ncbi:MAG: ATP-binding protein [Thermodesulfovibrionales bacterium]|nr:ATP-binding protein [Thermodesulfovibrionales bacterium]
MKRVLFRRILLSYIIIAPLLFIPLEIYLSQVIKDNHIAKLKESLGIQAGLIADEIPRHSKDSLDDFCRRYKKKTGARITVIASDGKVIGDSDELSEKMDNHIDRPEIQEAAVSSSGSSIRFSRTVQKDFFYFAVLLDEKKHKGFLRLAVPLHDMEKAISSLRMRIAIASIVTLLAAILTGLLQARKVTKSIEEIAAFSREVTAGDFKTRLFLKEKGEIGELAKNINAMAHELKKRLERSNEDRHRMEELLKNMPDGFVLLDAQGKVLICNPAAKKVFGVERDIEGRPLLEVIRNVGLTDIMKKVADKEESVVQEMEISYPKELYLMATAAPFYYPPGSKNVSGVMLSFHDITRLKQLEDMRRDFVANVSHEIKTPITAIKGFAETLLGGAIDDKENASRFLQTIKNHSERLNSLVEDLLTLSRIELGDIKIEKTAVSLDDVIDTVFTTLRNKAEIKGIYLKKEMPENLCEIKADRNRLTQILLNLVDNGIKFTDTGGVTVRARGTKDEGRETRDECVLHPSEAVVHRPLFIEISVEDTGIGIPQKHLSRLGERFYRVDSSRSRELGGTGLGLAIVKHLVKAHGWEMKIESTQGKGTIVSILCRAA